MARVVTPDRSADRARPRWRQRAHRNLAGFQARTRARKRCGRTAIRRDHARRKASCGEHRDIFDPDSTTDRRSFLLRPDLGRALHTDSRAELDAARDRWGTRELCVVVSDGLSALAAERQVTPLLNALVPLLVAQGLTLYPVFVAPFARVKLADEVGERLGARFSLILLGERPGLSSPDSLGAYLTFGPSQARTDADRNCVSNIRAEGLPCVDAARGIAELLSESARLGESGVALKLNA